MLAKRWIYPDDFRQLATSHSDFLSETGLKAAPGALLPTEFLGPLVERFCSQPEWMGFFAIRNGEILGSGMFKHPPTDGCTEIGYGVAPLAEGQGVATCIAAWLCEYAAAKGLIKIRANTLPDSSASKRVLEKNLFKFVGIFEDPEDGTVHRFEKML